MAHIVTPVIFIHGLWLHATSWGDWVKLFRRLGYDPIAPGWPGEEPSIHEARLLPEHVADIGIDQVTTHYAKILEQYDVRPVVIGHSFGGLVALKLLGDGRASAAVAIAPAQPKGVWRLPPTQIKASLPALKNPFAVDRAVSLTAYEFRYGFGNALSMEESTELFTRWAIPSPARPLFAAAFANFIPKATTAVDRRRVDRGPLLIIAGGQDHTVPASVARSTHKFMSKSPGTTDFHIFPDRGHSLVVDAGWREVADFVLAWLKERVPGAVEKGSEAGD